MNLDLARFGILATGLTALVPLALVQHRRHAAGSSQEAKHLLLIQIRLLLAVAIGVTVPAILLTVIPSITDHPNGAVIRATVVLMDWLPATVFAVLTILLMAFGTSIFASIEALAQRVPQMSRAAEHNRVVRYIAWATVLVPLTIYFAGPWTESEVTAVANQYPMWHFVLSLIWVAAAVYVVAPTWRRIFD